MTCFLLLALNVSTEMTPHEQSRWALIDSLISRGSFEIDPEIAGSDVAIVNDHYYSVFSPGLSLLLTPYAWLLRTLFKTVNAYSLVLENIGLELFSIVITAISALLLYRINMNIAGEKAAFISSLIIIFCTPIAAFGRSIFPHIYTMFFIVLAFYQILKQRSNHLLAAISLAMCFFLEYQTLILFLPMYFYAYFYRSKRDLITFLIYFIPTVIVGLFHLLYNSLLFGGPFNFPEKFWSGYPERPAEFSLMFSTPPHLGVYLLLLSPENGLLLITPILITSFIGLWYLRTFRSDLAVLIMALLCSSLLFYSAWHLPWGGGSFGPRFLIPVISILSTPLSVFIEKKILKSRLTGIFLFSILMFYSSAASSLGIIVAPDCLFNNAFYNLLRLRSPCIIPQLLGLIHVAQVIYWIFIAVLVNLILSLPLIKFYILKLKEEMLAKYPASALPVFLISRIRLTSCIWLGVALR